MECESLGEDSSDNDEAPSFSPISNAEETSDDEEVMEDIDLEDTCGRMTSPT